MKNERTIAITLVVAIVVLLSTLIVLTNEDIFDNIFSGEEKQTDNIIEIGDCVDVNYVLRYASNDTIIQETNGSSPLKVFVSKDPYASPPEEYSEYSANLLESFLDELIGLEENQDHTFTLSPEDAYGIPPEINDEIVFSFPGSDSQMLVIRDIKEDVPMPAEYISDLGNYNTTVFVLRFNISSNEKTTLYPSWENATEFTKVNETTAFMFTTPPEDKMVNFTWIETTGYGYWENATSVISMNETTIVLEHSPKIGDTMVQLDPSGYSEATYNVTNITSTKINCSYQDIMGDTSYRLFNKTFDIERNVSQNLVSEFPIDILKQIFLYYPQYGIGVNATFSLSPLAGEYLKYTITILEVYKTS